MSLEELKEIVRISEEEDTLRLNREMITHLRKRGVRVREFRLDEFEAS
ncbi:MAG: hypothetical protein U9O94_05845 [Nanoarchaeota archaeon]|nr:hypothetical protein [Nanoarchaeota archaeon]